MRTIKYIVIHCTATPQSTKVESIINFWKKVLGWKNPGYHILIDKKGKSHFLQPFEYPANGVKGYNQNSIHISYIGGVDENGKSVDNRTDAQKLEMLQWLTVLKNDFPKAKIQGHCDFPKVRKSCPSFDVKEWLKEIDL